MVQFEFLDTGCQLVNLKPYFVSADLGFCLIINYNIKLAENLNQMNQMKIDELPSILITDIFRHLEPGILLNL